MFAIHDENGYAEPVEGIEMKTLVHGEKTLLVRFKMTQGALLPSHTHPHEQTGYLISGRINLYIGGECRSAGPGDSWCIASGVEHRAEILKDSVAIEVFSPVREDYLP
ncbi:cupin domain-containing protein [Desulfobacter hydrogenophilus]|uniref:Cupin domain-containing protein n=1 Tax=Desulfobacter hydrogenophilus TaxID=2291 RepID=A0A328FCS2_9BACT|nr:cupin domain-containing protein [Desulfobacter hydrogenophilus]NDY71587.1 cupin domain-containing protein [Desulfobacter hydrogenophilus]QBH15364.1 cupin domain-containing protein [Desulfobacter hydrogenophilus]RAM02441.1 cupin domain-containing protein [Desulfobacter hydrogenophilus]